MVDDRWWPAGSLSRADRRALKAQTFERWLDRQAVLPDGRPAWSVAKLLPGMDVETFRARLKRGWSPERAATQPLRIQPNRIPPPGFVRLVDDD